jgi:hypothetical protein
MTDRVDPGGLAHKGSQLQTQIYVNRRPEELWGALQDALPTLPVDARLTWVSPVQEARFAEYQDVDFLRAIGLEQHAAALADFWPAGGPVWDALAVVGTDGLRPGVLLAEGKSYPDELFGGRCRASEPARSKVSDALARTQRWLGVAEDPERWMGRLYQTANRLAHLYWLREMVGVRAWRAHLLFVDDPHGPTSRDQWIAAVESANDELGLAGAVVPHAGHALLNARDRAELL